MKLLLTTFLLCVIVSNKIFAQKKLKYEQLVNDAELFLSDSIWKQACEKYKEAFEKEATTIYAHDLHNAAVCAILVEDFVFSIACVEKLILKGCDTTYFNQPHFYALKSTKNWNHLINKFDTLIAQRSLKIPAIYLDSLERRWQKDQTFSAQRKSVISDNANYLRWWITEFGFPNEDQIGLEIEDNFIQSNRAYIMLLHWFSANEDYLGLTSLLYKEVLNGNLRPEYLAGLPNLRSYKFGLDQNVVLLGYGDFMYECELVPELEFVVNENRELIGLTTFDEFKKITKFMRRDRRFIYPSDGRIMVIGGDYEESMNQTLLQTGYKKIGLLKDYIEK